jgi:NTP pyrophosphatase (non-canonical NTP hydrolase)
MRQKQDKQSRSTIPFIGLNEYQTLASKTDQNTGSALDGLAFPLLGLYGEVGTLLSALKKKQRDKESYLGYTDAVVEEFGDVLWYFSNIATRASLKLRNIAAKTSRGLANWERPARVNPVTFGDIQAKRSTEPGPNTPEFESALMDLAARVGLLVDDFHAGNIARNGDLLSSRLVDIFRALMEAADRADISLSRAAAFNLQKIDSRWPTKRRYPSLFDASFPVQEQLPRKIKMHIFEEKRGGRVVVVQRLNGVNIGSALTDNRQEQDDYRFHDAFHLAYAAILGWSPVLRALLKMKRKSQPKIDEAEDGQRAILIEEGISTLIFQRAARLNYFEGIHSLDYPLLKLIPEFVDGYEVERCPLWQWEKAILDGFTVFQQLRKHRRGVITADLERRKVSFSKLP